MQWTISEIDQRYVDGTLMPTTAHWRCTHADGEFSGAVYSTASVDGLADLSIDAVLAHIWTNGVNKEAAESAVMAQIESSKRAAQRLRIDAIVIAPAPGGDLAAAKTRALASVDDIHSSVIQAMVGSPTQVEKDTWSLKLDAANAVLAGRTPSAAGLAFLKISGLDGERLAWAKVVVAKSAGFASVVGCGEKLRAKARLGIDAAKSIEDVDAVLKASISEAEQVIAGCAK